MLSVDHSFPGVCFQIKILGTFRLFGDHWSNWEVAHIPDCFPKYSLNFIDGAGQVEGEILEALWSHLDEVAGLAQAMSIAHHQETVDEYMNDNNW